jgi:hypothetical protein
MGFRRTDEEGECCPPPFLALSAHRVRSRMQAAQVRRQGLASSARRAHEEHGNRTCLGKTFEHDLYIEGWEVGFYDALKFFRMRADGALAKVAGEGGDKIGCRNGFWSLEREENLFRSGNKVSEVELGRFVIVLGYE